MLRMTLGCIGPFGHRASWDYLRRLRKMAQAHNLVVFPEVQDQLALIRLCNTSPAFAGRLTMHPSAACRLHLSWRCNGCTASLHADLKTFEFTVKERDMSRCVTRIFRSRDESARSRVGSSRAAGSARL